MANNIIDSIQVSGTVYTLSAQTEGGGVSESAFTAYTASTNERISQDEEVTAAALNVLNESLSGKQDTLSAGTNITISGNVISAEGGGKAIEAGRGITITTGETADTVSFNLPISAGTASNSIKEGNGTTASGMYSHAEGSNTTASGNYGSHAEGNGTIANGQSSHAEGIRTIANNQSEHASGQYNVSNKANNTFGNSGNTLFSVGNGTADNARHNAFEIRQNGDIYITSGGTASSGSIKLQDTIGSKADKSDLGGLKLVKVTQAEYDALTTKDPNTLYIILG